MESPETDLSTASIDELVIELGKRCVTAVMVMEFMNKSEPGGYVQSHVFGKMHSAIGLFEQWKFKVLNGLIRVEDEDDV